MEKIAIGQKWTNENGYIRILQKTRFSKWKIRWTFWPNTDHSDSKFEFFSSKHIYRNFSLVIRTEKKKGCECIKVYC